MTAEAYMWGWIAYFLGGFGVLAAWCWLTRIVPLSARLPLRAALAALLFTPWPVSTEHSEWAPAWVVAIFDGFAQDGVSVWRVGAPLVAVLVVALVLSLVVVLVRRRRNATSEPVAVESRTDDTETNASPHS